jgi:hypothetical protein
MHLLVYFVSYINPGLKNFSVFRLLSKTVSQFSFKSSEPTIQPHTATRKVLRSSEMLVCVLQRSKTDVFQLSILGA